MNRQEKLVETFKKAIESFDAEAMLKRGMHPKCVKAMKDGLVSQYEELKEDLKDRSGKPPQI